MLELSATVSVRRFLVADDHWVARAGIAYALCSAYPDAQIDQAPDGMTAYQAVLDNEYDLAIVDLTMPRKDGLDLIKDIRSARPGLRILVISTSPEDECAERAYRAGADGSLGKTAGAATIAAAVDRILKGEHYVSEDYGAALARDIFRSSSRTRTDDDSTALSDREYQVLKLLSKGRSSTSIAVELGLSVKTVSTYRTRLLRKLGLQTTAELICYVLRNGIPR